MSHLQRAIFVSSCHDMFINDEYAVERATKTMDDRKLYKQIWTFE